MKKILSLIIVIALAVGGFYVYKNFIAKNPLDGNALEKVLENSSELTTQKLTVSSYFEENKGSIPIINKRKILVVYKATINAGFNVSEAEVKSDDDKIVVTIPHCTIDEDSVNIHPEEFDYFDTTLALYKPDKKVRKALESKAEKKAIQYAKSKNSGLLDNADFNAEIIVRGLFSGVANGKEVVVEFK